jgi:hypothetical protein
MEAKPMSDVGILIGRHSTRADSAADTPIFHALAAAETPIFHALTTAHETGRPVTRPDAEPLTQIGGPQLDPMATFYRDPPTSPIPIRAYTEPRTPVSSMTRPPRSLSGNHARPEQPRRTGRHHLMSPFPA